MNFPPNVIFYDELRLLTWKPHGILNEDMVNEIVTFVEQHEASIPESFNRFTDATVLDAIDLTFNFVFHVALCRRLTLAAHPSVKSAFLVSNQQSAHYFKLHALLTDYSPLQVKIFDHRDAAAYWLGVPREKLEMP